MPSSAYATMRHLAFTFGTAVLQAHRTAAQSQTYPSPPTSGWLPTTASSGSAGGWYSSWSTSNYYSSMWANFPRNFDTVRIAHGALGATTFLLLFPLGGILLRVFPNHHNIAWIHATIQMLGLAVFAAGAGCGIWTARILHCVSGFHPLIGMVVLALLCLQPATELANHFLYARWPRIVYVAHVHLWLGRVLLTAGIVNGGLGFVFKQGYPDLAPWGKGWRIAYGAVATAVWFAYVGVAVVWQEVKAGRTRGGVEGEEMHGLRGGRAEDGIDAERQRQKEQQLAFRSSAL